jgi:hypothetical protein
LRQDPEFYKKQLEKNRGYYKNARNDPEKAERMYDTRRRWRLQNAKKYKEYKKRCRENLKEKRFNEYQQQCDHAVQHRKQWRRATRTVEDYMKQRLPEEIKELKRRFVETIEKSAFIGITAKHLDISETRVYSWMKSDPKFELAVRNAQQRVAEKVGLTLINKAIQTEDTQALIFLCRTLGRNLGFDEKAPVVNINMGKEDSQLNLQRLSLDEKENLLCLLRKTQQSESEVVSAIADADVQEVQRIDNAPLRPDAVSIALNETIDVDVVEPESESIVD